MPKFAKIIICVLTTSLLISSCSFEKRLYTKGYHIDWASKSKKKESGSDVKINPVSENEHSAIKNPSKEETTMAVSTQELVSPIKIYHTTDNNSYVLAEENNMVTPSNAASLTIEYARPETKVSATDVIPKNKRLIKKLIRRGADDTVLYVILALLIPPLAMFFYEGENWTDRCTVNLILTLLCWLPGVFHALFVILDNR